MGPSDRLEMVDYTSTRTELEIQVEDLIDRVKRLESPRYVWLMVVAAASVLGFVFGVRLG